MILAMAKKEEEKQEQVVVINGEEHKVSDLSQEQINLLNHVADIEGKIRQTRFSLEQLDGSRNHFMGLLTSSLEAEAEPEVKVEATK